MSVWSVETPKPFSWIIKHDLMVTARLSLPKNFSDEIREAVIRLEPGGYSKVASLLAEAFWLDVEKVISVKALDAVII